MFRPELPIAIRFAVVFAIVSIVGCNTVPPGGSGGDESCTTNAMCNDNDTCTADACVNSTCVNIPVDDCGGDGSSSTEPDPGIEPANDPALIGTWDLVSGNGQPIAPGIYLRWAFTATTVTVTSDLDCTETLTYSSAGGILTGLSVISREGSACGDDDAGGEIGSYSVVGDTLAVTTTDPETEPLTVVSVFTKVP